MSKKEYLLRYLLIIRKLRNSRKATFEEIYDFIQKEMEIYDSDEFSISKRTFQRDMKEIATLFNIDIQFDFSEKVYYIANIIDDDIHQRYLEAFDLINSLNISQDLKKFILVEKRKASGSEHIYGLIHAIKNHFQVRFNYFNFDYNDFIERIIEPYVLKEFKNRWYLIGLETSKSKLRTYALDRIYEMDITRKKFIPSIQYKIEDQFRNCFGIIAPNADEPSEIILSFEPFDGNYIKSLPLHESQKILIDDKKEFRISLNIFITFDFIMEILSYGDKVKVIAPNNLKKEVKGIYKRALNNYNKPL